jgi:hypothetical protein
MSLRLLSLLLLHLLLLPPLPSLGCADLPRSLLGQLQERYRHKRHF